MGRSKKLSAATTGVPDRLRAFLSTEFKTMDRAIKAMGVSSSTMYRYISGSSRNEGQIVFPSGEFLIRLAELGCDIHWLFTGETPDRSSEDDPPMSFIDALRDVVNLLKGFERAANGDRDTFERMFNTYLDGLAAQRLLRTSDQSVQIKKLLADFGKRDEAFPDGSVGAAQQP